MLAPLEAPFVLPGYEAWTARYGDLHNHSDVSYGAGPAEAALANAALQLDFVSLTVHGAWPDVPTDDPDLAYLVRYHEEGFERARAAWADHVRLQEAAHDPGRFVTVPSFEWHSRRYGDHCVYFRDADAADILDAPDLPTLRARVAALDADALLIPHHIGYEHGHRGIDWSAFDAGRSPVVETMSFHGSAESCDGSVPYLHAMGPLDGRATARAGWTAGHRFGLVGSTDHHAAMPGAYGYGRLGAWMESLTRDGLWDALEARRTWALTGDRIDLALSVNGVAMGGVAPPAEARDVAVAVRGGDGLDAIEILHDERVVHRASLPPDPAPPGRVKVHLEVGWGERDRATPWDVAVRVHRGTLHDVEPRFRGAFPSVPPPEGEPFAPHALEVDGNAARFTTRTWPHPYSRVPASEGICLELDGDDATELEVDANGERFTVPLDDLRHGARTRHVGGFVSPAVRLRRAIGEAEFATTLHFSHRPEHVTHDLYRVRVRQRNDQWAWSSPVWVASDAGKE